MTNYEVIKTLTIEEMESFLADIYLDGFIDGNEDNEHFFFDKSWLCSEEYQPIIKSTHQPRIPAR